MNETEVKFSTNRKIPSALMVWYRLLAPIIDVRYFWRGLRDYPRYFTEYFRYRRLSRSAGVGGAIDLHPCLHERTSTTGFDSHYCYLAYWATSRLQREISVRQASVHVDVGSQISWVMAISALLRTVFIDIRPFESHIPSLSVKAGSILDLPFADQEVGSLSCLHVAEHIGLGRYGDPLDVSGTMRAMQELARVLAPGGVLLFAVPVGEERTCFNAHRVFSPHTIVETFVRSGLALRSFSGVDDNRVFHQNVDPAAFSGMHYACGMFEFIRG